MSKKCTPPGKRKRLKFSDFTIEEATDADAKRYVDAFYRLVYSYQVIHGKQNTEYVRRIESENLEAMKLARKISCPDEDEFLKITHDNAHVYFFVKQHTYDYGFAIVAFEEDHSAYISNFTVYKHLQGYGTLFYQMLESHLKNCGITKISLMCPFEGAECFWVKMGYTLYSRAQNKYHKSI